MSARKLIAPDPYPIPAEIGASVRVYPDAREGLDASQVAWLADAALWEVVRNCLDERGDVHFHRFEFHGRSFVLSAYRCADTGLEIEIAVNPGICP